MVYNVINSGLPYIPGIFHFLGPLRTGKIWHSPLQTHSEQLLPVCWLWIQKQTSVPKSSGHWLSQSTGLVNKPPCTQRSYNSRWPIHFDESLQHTGMQCRSNSPELLTMALSLEKSRSTRTYWKWPTGSKSVQSKWIDWLFFDYSEGTEGNVWWSTCILNLRQQWAQE